MENQTTASVSEEKSKSQVKRELSALKNLGSQLTELTIRQLQQIPMNETTRSAIIDALTMKKGALKRQLSYIGSLLKEEDEAALRAALDDLAQPHRQQVQAFHDLEKWRDRLLAGDNSALAELAEHFAGLDRQHLMQLVRKASKEQAQEKSPKSARAIFQYLKDLQTQDV